ncbi:MAG: ATP-binding protein [Candidatus Aenigmarchaeota archaeon]|nr:ATP-binding protein [Candidatus Aenigmarchaeota archaeon]
MIAKSLLETVVRDQRQEFAALGKTVSRTMLHSMLAYRGTAACVVKGVRRCGKSTLLQQLMAAKYPDDFYYVNFDDERVADFTKEDFQPLMETLLEAFGKKTVIFFDEIQNVRGWELFVNRLLREGNRVFLTGSNAHLLSRELGTHLTGRHVDVELFPFSFAEFLRARGDEPRPPWSTAERVRLKKALLDYLDRGGMPEAVVMENDQLAAQLLQDIMQKDILGRVSIRKPAEMRSVLRFLIANAGNPATVRSLMNNFGIRSANTLQKYIACAEDSYLVFTVRRFDRKIKRLDRSPRKVYCIDTGMVFRISPGVTERRDALLENAVAVHLKRLGKEAYYYRGGGETDFVLPRDRLALQVCTEVTARNKERELRGLREGMRAIKATRGLILTLDQEETRGKVRMLPVWRWLLEQEGPQGKGRRPGKRRTPQPGRA